MIAVLRKYERLFVMRKSAIVDICPTFITRNRTTIVILKKRRYTDLFRETVVPLPQNLHVYFDVRDWAFYSCNRGWGSDEKCMYQSNATKKNSSIAGPQQSLTSRKPHLNAAKIIFEDHLKTECRIFKIRKSFAQGNTCHTNILWHRS